MKEFSSLKTWLYAVSRGYTLPMSLLPCLIALLYIYKLEGNLLYGVIATIGVVCAHLGTNVFDDFIDFITKTPKQKCKTAYLDNNFTTPGKIFIFAMFYFAIAACIGVFFLVTIGWKVLIPTVLGGLICITYPKMTRYCIGELALALAFGPLLFGGISYVALGYFNINMLLISVPVSIFITVLLVAHALMDYDFDKQCGKKTFCTVLGSKTAALKGIMILITSGYLFTVALILFKILPYYSALTLISIFFVGKFYIGMLEYISSSHEDEKDFMKVFKLARCISVVYNVILLLSISF